MPSPNGLRAMLRRVRGWLVTVRSRFLMRRLYRGERAPEVPKRVLFWIPGGMPAMLDVEGTIAAALRARGTSTPAILCDGAYTACIRRDVRDKRPISEWRNDCASCKQATSGVLERLGIPYTFIGDYVDAGTRERLRALSRTVTWESLDGFVYEGLKLGMNIRSAIIRYLQGHDLPEREELVHEYAYSALVCAHAAKAAYAHLEPDRVFMSHGVYVDWGPALHTALNQRLPVVAWMASYLKARFYFRNIEDHERIDFHNMSAGAWEHWGRQALTGAQEAQLDDFLAARYKRKASFDMKELSAYTGDLDGLRTRLRLPPGKPVWGILAHINWDTVSDYSPMAYSSFNEWMIDTVRHLIPLKSATWLIKVHPAESWDNPESGVQRLLQKTFPHLPDHVRIVTAEERISPLEFFQLVDGGITVYGTAGLELALMGKPVICAGEAHYGGKGFTHDGLTIGAYRALLSRTPSIGPLDANQTTLARRYAYTYFVRRQIPLAAVNDPESEWWRFRLERRNTLLPGQDPFVDMICRRIQDGRDFILDDELVAVAS